MQKQNQSSQPPQQPGASLHGETAVRRQAITELLFFSSVGDLHRCKKIVHTWNIQPRDSGCCDYDRRTALHLAAAEGSYSVTLWLLETCGVEPNSVDRFKRTPLEDAVRGDHGEVAVLLQKYGAKVVNKEGELVDLSESPLSYNVRIFGEFDPEWEIDPSNLKMEGKIGEGEFGVVYKARWHGSVVAVKVLKDHNAVALGDFRTELNVLQKVHHPHAVQFLGAVTKGTPYMIVTEYMSGGSLADLFKKNASSLTLRRSLALALDTARGMAYLHNRQPQAVIHRDLKPANLMIGGFNVYTEEERLLQVRQIGALKIADFGLSKSLKLKKSHHLSESEDSAHTRPPPGKGDVPSLQVVHEQVSFKPHQPSYLLTGETGSYRYMAPEVFRHEPYNTKVDVYAFAMICFQLFEGMAPFHGYDPVEAARLASMDHQRPKWGLRNRWGLEVPLTLRDLVESCWAADYDERPDFEHIIVVLEKVLNALPADPGVVDTAKHGCCTIS